MVRKRVMIEDLGWVRKVEELVSGCGGVERDINGQ